jgi:hypothetical protein
MTLNDGAVAAQNCYARGDSQRDLKTSGTRTAPTTTTMGGERPTSPFAQQEESKPAGSTMVCTLILSIFLSLEINSDKQKYLQDDIDVNPGEPAAGL